MAPAPRIHLIAAVGKRGQIGIDGTMPWLDDETMAWFRELTFGDIVVLGRRTFETTRCWADREKLCMSRAESPSDIINRYIDRKIIWIGGGATIYKLWLPFVEVSLIRQVSYDGPADVWMPNLWFPDRG